MSVETPGPRYVFVLWDNEHIDLSVIHSVYATEEAARAAAIGCFFDVTCVPFYEY